MGAATCITYRDDCFEKWLTGGEDLYEPAPSSASLRLSQLTQPHLNAADNQEQEQSSDVLLVFNTANMADLRTDDWQ